VKVESSTGVGEPYSKAPISVVPTLENPLWSVTVAPVSVPASIATLPLNRARV